MKSLICVLLILSTSGAAAQPIQQGENPPSRRVDVDPRTPNPVWEEEISPEGEKELQEESEFQGIDRRAVPQGPYEDDERFFIEEGPDGEEAQEEAEDGFDISTEAIEEKQHGE